MTEQYNAFEGLNLSNARSEDETRVQYKTRLRTNRKILKLYEKVGREQFKQMFPNGVHEALENSAKEIYDENQAAREAAVTQKSFSVGQADNIYNEEDAKKFIKEQQKNAEKLGEAK